ncbi:MAG: iron transporter [Clostridiales bacterium]|nr:iron transporter [Clostridiales bacterium]
MRKMNAKTAFSSLLCIAVLCLLLAACGQKPDGKAPIADGVYSADFKTDGSMFHVNEAHHGKGTLTVKDGRMTIHITMPSKNTVNLFPGSAEDAKKEGAALIEPTLDTVTYEDGSTEEVYGFDIPVPYLDKEFDCALVGTKGKWYDHKVSVSNPEPITVSVEDGEYLCEVALSGGSGKASVESPAKIVVKDGKMTATIVWSSSHYEYMTLGETKYEPVNTEGNSTFEIPVELDRDIAVSALTTAMSEPHLIDYVLRFDGASLRKAE